MTETEPTKTGKVIVGLSGGVDSAVAALLLVEKGHRVDGLFMKNWEEDDTADYCTAAADLEDAQAVADRLGITLHGVNFATEYWDRVFTYFLAEYRAGRTPNPDVLCNKEIKFKAFLEHARSLDADRIATGHYARLEHDDRGTHLIMGADPAKDQTYFLYLLGQKSLSNTLFPLGGLKKDEVRALARKAGFPNADKKDSTGICFIGERRFRDFLKRYLTHQPGPIETPEGRLVGAHQGLCYFTIGQRQGLGIGGVKDTAYAPWFVVGKDPARNCLIVAQGHDHPLLYHRCLEARQVHWIAGRPPAAIPFACTARIRHRHPVQPCTLVSALENRCQVSFRQPQWAIAPGQSVVFYKGVECLGGAVIERAFNP